MLTCLHECAACTFRRCKPHSSLGSPPLVHLTCCLCSPQLLQLLLLCALRCAAPAALPRRPLIPRGLRFLGYLLGIFR